MASSSGSPAGFPKFADGDTTIVISGARQLCLHASVLRNASPKFERLLNEEWAAQLSRSAIKKGIRVRWRIVLAVRPKENSLLPDFGFTVHKLDESGRPLTSQHDYPALDFDYGLTPPPIHRAVEAVIAAIYNTPIDFGNPEKDTVVDILTECMAITEVAEYLSCVDIVSKPIEATLLSKGQDLWRSIRTDPAGWLMYFSRIRSRVLYREAFTQCVGQYHVRQVYDQREEMSDALRELLDRKALGLKTRVQDAIMRCATYYPPGMTRSAPMYGASQVDRNNINRDSYANDIYAWVALTVVRHWLLQQVTDDSTHNAEDLGFETIDSITKAGDAFLAADDLAHFHRFFPMSEKGKAIIQGKVGEIKDRMKTICAPLMVNECQLNVRECPTPYLLCTKLEFPDDYVWEKKLIQDGEEMEIEGEESEFGGGDD